jgi:tetratricopeptide (TPR) repeat protein
MLRLAFLTILLVVASVPYLQFRAWAQTGSEADVYVDRGILAFERKRYEDGLKELDEALRANPKNVDALYYKSLVLSALKRPQEALAVLNKARAIAPNDLGVLFQLGVVYFSLSEYPNAEPFLKKVAEVDPKHPNLGFYLGVIEYRKKNYRTALNYFADTIPSDKEFKQLVRFYSGLSKSALGFPADGATDLREALTIRPSSPLGNPARRFARLLDERADRERRFFAKARFGIFYDTNPAVLPDDSGDVVVQSLLAGAGNEKSGGQVISSEFGYSFIKNMNWEATVSHRFYQTLNNAIPKLNLQGNTPAINLVRKGDFETRLGNMAYNAGVQGSYEYLSLGNAPFLNTWVFNPYISLAESPSNLTFLQYRFRYRDFANDGKGSPSERRSGANYMTGFLHYLTFKEGRHFVNAGYQFEFDNANGSNWRHYGHRLLAGFQYTLPWWDVSTAERAKLRGRILEGLRYRFQLDVQWRNYTDENTLINLDAGVPTTRRADFEMLFFSSISRDFAWFKQKFTVAMDYLYDQNFSNLAPYTYKRHVITTSLTWTY